MKNRSIFRIVFALGLAVLLGVGLSSPSSAEEAKKPANAPATAQFRSIGRNDGLVREYADDYWFGGSKSAIGSSIAIGDDNARRLVVGILDFDTSSLPDTANIVGATLEIRVVTFNTRFGDPYWMLGDIYADIASPYFGTDYALETWDFESGSLGYAGFFYQVFGANEWALMDVDFAALPNISVTDHTQFRLYFIDDNDDPYAQTISFASGNYPRLNFRPVLTVYFDIP